MREHQQHRPQFVSSTLEIGVVRARAAGHHLLQSDLPNTVMQLNDLQFLLTYSISGKT